MVSSPAAFGELGWLWKFLHVPDPNAGELIRIDYPIIPWAGVMAVGYALGPLFGESPQRTQTSTLMARLLRHRRGVVVSAGATGRGARADRRTA